MSIGLILIILLVIVLLGPLWEPVDLVDVNEVPRRLLALKR